MNPLSEAVDKVRNQMLADAMSNLEEERGESARIDLITAARSLLEVADGIKDPVEFKRGHRKVPDDDLGVAMENSFRTIRGICDVLRASSAKTKAVLFGVSVDEEDYPDGWKALGFNGGIVSIITGKGSDEKLLLGVFAEQLKAL